LAGKARDAYRQSIDVARKVLSSPDRPSWFANYTIREVEFEAYHGWSVLEGTVAECSADGGQRRVGLLRSAMLALLTFEPNRWDTNARACGTLSLTLINMGSYDLAAKVTAALIDLKGAPKIIRIQRRMLSRHGVKLPRGGVDLLDTVFASLCTGPLLAEWETVNLFANRQEHVRKLLEILNRASEWFPKKDEIETAMLQLHAEAES